MNNNSTKTLSKTVKSLGLAGLVLAASTPAFAFWARQPQRNNPNDPKASNYSAPLQAPTPTPTPTPCYLANPTEYPTGLAITDANDNDGELGATWNAFPGATQYEVIIGGNSNFTTNTFYTQTGLTNGINHDVKVRVYAPCIGLYYTPTLSNNP